MNTTATSGGGDGESTMTKRIRIKSDGFYPSLEDGGRGGSYVAVQTSGPTAFATSGSDPAEPGTYDDVVPEDGLVKCFVNGPSGDSYTTEGEIESITWYTQGGSGQRFAIYVDGQEIDPANYDGQEVESREEFEARYSNGDLGQSSGLLGGFLNLIPGLLPGIGPFNSSETTALAIIISLGAVGVLKSR